MTKKTDDMIAIKEMEEKIVKMKEDKEKKCKAAKEQLVSSLEVTVDKYRTATGTAEALRTLRFIIGENSFVNLSWASRLAWDMACEADKMRKKAEKLSYAKMDELCDEFYEKEFKVPSETEDHESVYSLAFELMRIDLCRNVGGAAEDMVEFIKRTESEIDSIGKELKKLKGGK